MVNSNSLILLIPLLKFPEKILKLFSKSITQDKNLDKLHIFEAFEKLTIINQSYDLNLKKFKQYFQFRLPTKIQVFLDLYVIKTKKTTLQKSEYLTFLKLEFYSSYHNIDYLKFIQRCQENKSILMDLISFLILDSKDSEDFQVLNELFHKYSIHQELCKLIPLIHCHVIFFNKENEIPETRRVYRTNMKIVNNPLFNISLDSIGLIMSWHIKGSTRNSARNARILVIRSFIMRYFSWINKKSKLRMNFIKLIQNYISYYNYLISDSRNWEIYLEITKVNDYKLDYSHVLIVFDILNQNSFLKKGFFEIRLREIEKFLKIHVLKPIIINRFAFLIDKSLRNNPQAIEYMSKIGWNLVYVEKEKKTDYDSILQTFVEELCLLYTKRWSTIVVVSSDSNIVNHFIKRFGKVATKSLIFITNQLDINLNARVDLNKQNYPNLTINLYFYN